ncbi:MAG: DUF2336 domain-containing protein [Parvularculaceae bacterium]|nr:DUF2336 domain-containing protein [Parvularculaceae bacterium]
MSGEQSRLKQLIALAKEDSAEKRGALLREITDVFMAAPDRYTSSEMQHFDVIMSKVTENVEAQLRRQIAEKLADAPTAPKGLLRQLALDEIMVAEPVLKRSVALSEDDLIRVIRQRGQEHMKAISQRREIPETVTAALVDRGDKNVLVSVASNKGARLNAETMEKLVEHSRTIGDLQAPMASRYDLPPQLLTQMYFFVSSALKKEILKRSDMLDPALIDEAVEANRQKILSSAVTEAQGSVDAARAFIRDRIVQNALNESLLKELVEARKATEFLYGFAHYVGIDTSTAQRILGDRSWESLAISCRASGLERQTFAKIVFGLQRTADEQQKGLRILDLYLKIPQEAAERVMRFWRVRAQAASGEQRKKRVSIHEVAERAAG